MFVNIMVIGKVLVGAILVVGGHCVNLIFKNHEIGPIWVGTLGNNGKTPLSNGGFNIDAGAETTINAPDDWAGRFWARTWCNPYKGICETGDCGNKLECDGNSGIPPATLVEITLRGEGGLDYYDISLAEGFNLKAFITPINGSGDEGIYSCRTAACNYYINDECPSELALIGSAGFAIGCKSACVVFNTDQYCCRNNYGSPQTCKSYEWPLNYPAFFKERCPEARTYDFDDTTSSFTCVANTYRIEFGKPV